MDASWPLLLIGVLIGMGFGALFWWRDKEGSVGGKSQRDVTLYFDIIALGATILMVGSLSMLQLSTPPEPADGTGGQVAVQFPPENQAPSPSVGNTTVVTETAPISESTSFPISPTIPSSMVAYTVQAGDTLETIAAQYGSSVDELRTNNGLSTDQLQPGQVLFILPPPSDIPPAEVTATPEEPTAIPEEPTATAEAPTATAEAPTATPVPPTATATPEPPTATPTPASVTVGVPYTIQQGDRLGDLAPRFGVSVDNILAFNPGLNINTLRPGQVISIPQLVTVTPIPQATEPPAATPTTPATEAPAATPTTPATATSAPTETPTPVPPTPVPPTATTAAPQNRTYTVQPGDTLFEIAQRYGVSSTAIIQLNPNINPDGLLVGSVLQIPAGNVAPQPRRGNVRYTVQRGDVLSGIAARFGVTVAQIQAVNPNINPASLQIGQVIFIPNQPLQ